MRFHILQVDPHDPTSYRVWNHRLGTWATCVDILYEACDGFGYASRRYAMSIGQKLTKRGESCMTVLSYHELVAHIKEVNNG